MTPRPSLLSEIDAVVFDVIGTLVDEDATFAATATAVAANVGVGDGGALRREWVALLDSKMTDVVAGAATWRPHAELVAEAGREAVESLGGAMTPWADRTLRSVDREYPAWPDVSEAIRILRSQCLVVGLSNGDIGSLARLASRNDLEWHTALSTSVAKTFKPADAAYRLAIESLELDPARTLFVAAHPWDLRAAARHGFRTAYIARPLAERPDPADRFDGSFDSLLDLV